MLKGYFMLFLPVSERELLVLWITGVREGKGTKE